MGFLTVVASDRGAADTRETLTEVTLRAKPGESQPAVATYAKGTKVEVLKIEGRWLRIRAADSIGWVPRTKLSEPPAAAIVPTPAARTSRLTVTVHATGSVLRAGGAADAAVIAPVAVGAALEVVDARDPVWIHVTDGAGHDGWIESARLANASPDAAPARIDRPASRPAAIAAPARVGARVSLGIGYRSLGERFTSNATGGLADYLVSADATVADVDAELVLRPRPRWIVAFDGRVRASYSSPGIAYPGPTLPPGDIPFTMFEAGGGARAGLHRGALDVALRAGLRYGAFLADEVDNAGRMPRERLLGATAGVRVELVPARARFGVAAGADWMVIGERRQTPGLEDGETSDAGALWLDMRVHYQLAPRVIVFGAFAYERATTRWQGMSQRWADVTEAERVDSGQTVQLGVGTRL